MGQGTILKEKQKIILAEFKADERLSSFYFTGGTALSEYYLKHRESEDLDFFTKEDFDSQIVLEAVNLWSRKYDFLIQSEFVDPTYRYTLKFKNGEKLKVDFAKYPYPNLKEPKKHNGLKVDSFFDIATNKFLLANQRTEVKDFVDLYYIFEKFNFWELKDGVQAKFNIEIDLYMMATDFMKVKNFENLPKMLKDLKLKTLKEFFIEKARKLSKDTIE
ncbi:nucleotidyl transferase AbiEii/AbiGii toxin family protein [Patescibacteria group bacterium]|nr:nucleotidyl transferase AbiEii/AbiGii toxin family protein [Patescibacteria group bacterium]MBU2036403.1 nucleotidyl transferase AbiEii/AbiGii toxin family protein [Patescibacteria group bacterium]